MARKKKRDLKKEAFWRRMIRGQAQRGAWCARHALREPAFYWWRAQLAQRDREAARGGAHAVPRRAALAPLVPVRVVPDEGTVAPGRIEIVLPGERRVHVVGCVERKMLADVLALLTSSVPEAPGC